MNKALHQVGEYVMLMGKCISVPNREYMFAVDKKKYSS